jgi:hypothetical protein
VRSTVFSARAGGASHNIIANSGGTAAMLNRRWQCRRLPVVLMIARRNRGYGFGTVGIPLGPLGEPGSGFLM